MYNTFEMYLRKQKTHLKTRFFFIPTNIRKDVQIILCSSVYILMYTGRFTTRQSYRRYRECLDESESHNNAA